MALCDREHDDFYLDAFLIQEWLGQVRAQVEQQYSGKSRILQMGQSQCAFLRVFGHSREADFQTLVHSLYRFAEYGEPIVNALSCALMPLALEHELAGDFDRMRSPDPSKQPREAMSFMRSSLERWCDWTDAVVHLQTHARWHLAPETLHKTVHPGAIVAQNGSSGNEAGWPFQEVDEAAICLWPLVKRHNWSYGDLRNVLRDVLRRPEVHPCRSEQTLANYCTHALGLRKTGRSQTCKDNRPTGYEVALRLCPPVRKTAGLGLPPWP
ncbi:MAG TPA: hypothetical protein VN673_17245 [Clostridia bacterium]|nr:hypothetical protein [Clostridia bacterium]